LKIKSERVVLLLLLLLLLLEFGKQKDELKLGQKGSFYFENIN